MYSYDERTKAVKLYIHICGLPVNNPVVGL